MAILKSLFNYHHDKVATLLDQASNQTNEGIWLYLNDLRTPMFMLEACARIAEDVYEKNVFEELRLEYKSIEDELGKLDYYAAFYKQFSNDKKVDPKIIEYLFFHAHDKADQLNEALRYEDWLYGDKIRYINSRLDGFKWKKEKKEGEAILKYFLGEIEEVVNFTEFTEFHFDNVEEDVHELRRKIRWLSIYPQATQGLFAYAKASKPKAYQQKYLSAEVVNSPYNVIPTTFKFEEKILLDKNCFLSMSWVILELGKLKDNGLGIEVLTEAIQNTSFTKTKDAETQAYAILGKKQLSMQQILDKAEEITKAFIKEKNLENMVINQ